MSWEPWLYYLAVARVLMPSFQPAFGAWVRGSRQFPDGVELEALASSVLERLVSLVRGLDELVMLWHRNFTNSAEDEMRAKFDDILLRLWATQDNLALLAGKHLGVKGLDPIRWSLGSREWRAALRETGARGSELADLAASMVPRVDLVEQLRHHAAHRATLRWTAWQENSNVEPVVRLQLPSTLADPMRSALRRMNEDPSAWGMGREIPAATGRHVMRHTDEWVDAYEESMPATTMLDPVPFAVRLVATLLDTANQFMRVLRPQDDPRLPKPYRELAMRPPRVPWARPEAAAQIILSSPLAGVCPWAPSL